MILIFLRIDIVLVSTTTLILLYVVIFYFLFNFFTDIMIIMINIIIAIDNMLLKVFEREEPRGADHISRPDRVQSSQQD